MCLAPKRMSQRSAAARSGRKKGPKRLLNSVLTKLSLTIVPFAVATTPPAIIDTSVKKAVPPAGAAITPRSKAFTMSASIDIGLA